MKIRLLVSLVLILLSTQGISAVHLNLETLYDQANQKVSFQDDKITVLMFVYTNCKATCSTLTKSVRQIWDSQDQRTRSRLRYISVTFDWKDSAEDLEHFRQHYELPATWITARSDASTLHRLMDSFHFQILSEQNREFSHPSKIFFLDSQFRTRSVFEGATISMSEFEAIIKKAGASWNVTDAILEMFN